MSLSSFVPFYLSGADGPPEPGPVLNFGAPPAAGGCVVANTVLTVRFRGVSGATVTSPDRDFGGTSPKLSLQADTLALTVYQPMIEGKPITGAVVGGTSCIGQTLELNGTALLPVISATPPYTGKFQPTGAGGMAVFNGLRMPSSWSLEMSNLNGPVVIECWSVSFDLVNPTP